VQGLAHAEPIGAEARPSHLRENLTIALLLFGSLLVIAGWFFGVALLWTSDRWSRRDKIIGTLLLPGGIPVALLFALIAGARFGSCGVDSSGRSTGCSYGPSLLPEPIATALLVLGIAIPMATAIYLHRSMSTQPS
jgi:Kef-type K+ transport system membrane component KefB